MTRHSHRLVIGVVFGLLLASCGGDNLDADAGADFTITVGESPMFDGCTSAGDIENYEWTIVEAPDAVSGDEGKMIRELDTNCSFTLEAAMEVQEVGRWVIELTVTDGDGGMSSDQVAVEVTQ